MGQGWAFYACRKKPEIVRREPFTEAQKILTDPEALEMIWFALKTNPPGTKMRWDKLIDVANRLIEPTEEEPDPIRLNIDRATMKEILIEIYKNTTSASAESLKLMRELIPIFYDKHTYDRAKKVAHFYRDQHDLKDDMYAYGEVDYEIFATIYSKICRAFGQAEKGWFVDLGSGAGQLVYTAALISNPPLVKCYGVENVGSLLDRGSKRMVNWDINRNRIPSERRQIEFQWIRNNFLENTHSWYDATMIFLNWTAFNTEQVELMGELINQTIEGVIVITTTRPIPNKDLEVLLQDRCKTSFGEVDVFIQEKMTLARDRPERDFMAEI